MRQRRGELIWRTFLLLRPKRVLLPVPSFSEYADAARASSAKVVTYPLREQDGFLLTEDFLSAITSDTDAVVLGNPNNPTGRTVPHALLLRIAARCQDIGALLIVDECFFAVSGGPDAHTLKALLADHTRLLLLRAFTKVYGLAGLRIGYCLCSDAALLSRIRAFGQPWSVSLPAQAAGIAALSDLTYIRRSRALISHERAYLKAALLSVSCHV